MPLFRTFDELKEDQIKVITDYRQEFADAYRTYDADQATIKKMEENIGGNKPDGSAFSKILESSDRLTLFKAYVAAELGDIQSRIDAVAANQRATAHLMDRLQAAIQKRDDGLLGVGEVARRTARFASARRRSPGPSATVLSIGAKQK